MKATRPNDALRRWTELLALPEREARQQAIRWDWYALLRLVQCAYPDSEHPRIGYGLGIDEEIVRLGQPTFFHHPGTTIADFAKHGPRETPVEETGSSPAMPKRRANDRAVPAWIYSYHLGLFGPYGPLPLHLTEYASRHQRDQDPAFFAFCNVLAHRFLCFFFRAWADGRKEMSLDRLASCSGTSSAFSWQDVTQHGEECWEFFLGTLIGCGLDSMRSRDRLPEDARIFYAGRLLHPTRNAEGLCAILQDYFALPARILEFQPRTLPIPEGARWKLGADSTTGRLGWSTLVGAAVVDYQSGFRIRLGPLSLDQLEQLLPDTEGFNQLHDWVRLYCGKETDPNPEAGLESAWDLQLVLRGADVPELKFGGRARLGWTTWLYSKQPEKAVDDLVLHPRLRPTKGAASPVEKAASESSA